MSDERRCVECGALSPRPGLCAVCRERERARDEAERDEPEQRD